MKSCDIFIDGIFLNSGLIGDPSFEKPILVFLHEGLGSIPQWKEFPRLLSEKMNLSAFLYERKGYGHSSPALEKRTSLYMHQEAGVLEKILEKMKIQHPIFIGHSDGGSIALLYRSKTIKPVAIVTLAAHVFVEEVTLQGIQKSVETYRTTSLPQKLGKYHSDQTDRLFWSWADTWLSPQFRDWNITKEISSISCPVLILQGENDEYGTRLQCEAIQRSVSGPAQIEMIANCAHSPHLEQRELTTKITADFLNGFLKQGKNA